MNGALTRRIRSARNFGVLRTARVALDRSFLAMLRAIYQFDPWHAAAPVSARPYRKTVADVVNALHPGTVVEVGCGLGHILNLVEAPIRLGYDIDRGAIKAARLLFGRKISFRHGDISSVVQPQIDVLILVNWIHGISPEELERLLEPLLPRTSHLLLDAIDPDGPSGYRYKHDFSFLRGRAQLVSVTRPAGEGRTFHLFRVPA